MIGVYDSGLGGLGVLRALRKRMPRADLLYLGDTLHLPYGEKPPGVLQNYAEQAFAFFEKQAISALVVACGTVSATVLESGRPCAHRYPIFGVVRPAAERALALGCRRIAVLATEATVKSGVYSRLLRQGRAEQLSLGCPSLVPLAESRAACRSDRRFMREIEAELSPLRDFSPDAIILGCTHFPLFAECIGELYPSAVLIDCGAAALDALPARLFEVGGGKSSYCVTGSPELFRASAERMGLLDGRETVRKVRL